MTYNGRRKDKTRRKAETWRADKSACHYCGQHTHNGQQTIDHIVPKSMGGSNASWNLVAACFHCNSKLGAEFVKCSCAKCVRARRRWHAGRQVA